MISNDKRENGTYQNQDTKLNTKCDPNFIIVLKIYFRPCCAACGILVFQAGMNPGPSSENSES